MTDINTAAPVWITVDNIIDSGTGFGFVSETGANVFIAARVVRAAGMQIGYDYLASLQDNAYEERRGQTPYSVSYIVPEPTIEPVAPVQLALPLEDEEPEVPEGDLEAPVPTVEAIKPVALALLAGTTIVTVASFVERLRDVGYNMDAPSSSVMAANLLHRLWKSEDYDVARYAYTLSEGGKNSGCMYTRRPLDVTYTCK
jgi:hypothetical protein